MEIQHIPTASARQAKPKNRKPEDRRSMRRLILYAMFFCIILFLIVGTADNGLDGIDLIRKLHPDVVIIDVMMPGASGLEVIDAVAEEKCKFIIVCLCPFMDPADYYRNLLGFRVQKLQLLGLL